MLEKIRNASVISHSLIYLVSSVIAKGAPLLLLPFLTHILEPEEFGLLAIFLVVNSLYGAFIGMNLHANVTKNFFSCSRSRLALITGNVLIILIVSFVAYFLVTLLLVFSVDFFLSIPSDFFLLLPFLSVFTMLNQIHLTVLRNEGRAYRFGVFEISNAFISVGVSAFFLIVLGFGWLSQILGMFVSNFLLSLFGLFYLKKYRFLDFSFSKIECATILKISVPLIPHVLGGVIVTTSDRLFIESMVGLEAVALYSVGYSFGMLVALFTDSLVKAWSPWFYMQLAKPTHERKIRIVQTTYAYLIFVFVLAFVVSSICEVLLPYVVDERYLESSNFILWVALGYAVQGIYKIFLPYLVHISKTKFLAFSSVTAASSNISLNYFLIPEYGALGASYATIMSFAISSALVFEYQRRRFPMPWSLFSFKK